MAEPYQIIIGAIVLFAIIIPVGVYAINAAWTATDQVVVNSGSSELQKSYDVGKAGINTASDVEDSFALARSLAALAAIIGIPAVGIRAILKL